MSNATTTANKVATKPNFRTNKDQQVNFYGLEVHTVKFMGVCPVSGIRMYDMPGSPYPAHDFNRLVAAEYGYTGPDFFISYYASNDREQAAKGLELAKKTWLPGPEQTGPTHTVIIRGLRWFDRANGNTYFSAVGVVNGLTVARIDFAYGYGEHYRDEMTDKLEKLGFLPGREHYKQGAAEAIWVYADRLNIEQSYTVQDVTRRRDL